MGKKRKKKRFKDILEENFPKIKRRFEFLDLKGLWWSGKINKL